MTTVFALRVRTPRPSPRPYRTWGYPVTPVHLPRRVGPAPLQDDRGSSSSRSESLWGLAIILMGIPAYFVFSRSSEKPGADADGSRLKIGTPALVDPEISRGGKLGMPALVIPSPFALAAEPDPSRAGLYECPRGGPSEADDDLEAEKNSPSRTVGRLFIDWEQPPFQPLEAATIAAIDEPRRDRPRIPSPRRRPRPTPKGWQANVRLRQGPVPHRSKPESTP